MQTIPSILESRLAAAVGDSGGVAVTVQSATDARHGDYQSNVAMQLAKVRKANPRQVAQEILAKLDVADLCAPPEIAGAGFLNFRLLPQTLDAQIAALAGDARLGVPEPTPPRNLVVDFSGPNIAKSMHVGHIRSTILGAALVRIARFIGHKVTSDNHIGDWGTQFGKLLVGWKRLLDSAHLAADPISELERLYKIVNFACELPPEGPAAILAILEKVERPDSAERQELERIRGFDDKDFAILVKPAAAFTEGDHFAATLRAFHRGGFLEVSPESPAAEKRWIQKRWLHSVKSGLALATEIMRGSGVTILDQAKSELLALQNGDAGNLAIWQEMIRLSQAQFDAIYARLDIQFDVSLGESSYNDRLKPLVDELLELGIAKESNGAIAILSEGVYGDNPPANEKNEFLIRDKDGEWVASPLIIRKSDGASNYATTDLATLFYRVENFRPDEILYVTDGRQQLHFRQIFATWRRWHPESKTKLAHVWFGSILGEDGKPFKTRSGDTVKLADLLDEAEERASVVVAAKNPELPEAERREIARVVGLGAVKYSDLLSNRQSDYVFSWDKMLSFQGNTAPYLQNAHVRCCGIFRKAAEAGIALPAPDAAIAIREPAERVLAIKLAQFGEVLPMVLDDYRPNLLCNYLFELAGAFHSFFEACPVLKAAVDAERDSRLGLCALTARVLKTGLGLLGIVAPERM